MGNLQINNVASTQHHKENKGITYVPAKNNKPENVFNKKDTIKFDNSKFILDKEKLSSQKPIASGLDTTSCLDGLATFISDDIKTKQVKRSVKMSH